MSQSHRELNPCSMVGRLICYITKMKITSIYYYITFYFTMNFFNNFNQINIIFIFYIPLSDPLIQSFVDHSIELFFRKYYSTLLQI
jgi:hypothetical protein